jgi:hypothetical protein
VAVYSRRVPDSGRASRQLARESHRASLDGYSRLRWLHRFGICHRGMLCAAYDVKESPGVYRALWIAAVYGAYGAGRYNRVDERGELSDGAERRGVWD